MPSSDWQDFIVAGLMTLALGNCGEIQKDLGSESGSEVKRQTQSAQELRACCTYVVFNSHSSY